MLRSCHIPPYCLLNEQRIHADSAFHSAAPVPKQKSPTMELGPLHSRLSDPLAQPDDAHLEPVGPVHKNGDPNRDTDRGKEVGGKRKTSLVDGNDINTHMPHPTMGKPHANAESEDTAQAQHIADEDQAAEAQYVAAEDQGQDKVGSISSENEAINTESIEDHADGAGDTKNQVQETQGDANNTEVSGEAHKDISNEESEDRPQRKPQTPMSEQDVNDRDRSPPQDRIGKANDPVRAQVDSQDQRSAKSGNGDLFGDQSNRSPIETTDVENTEKVQLPPDREEKLSGSSITPSTSKETKHRLEDSPHKGPQGMDPVHMKQIHDALQPGLPATADDSKRKPAQKSAPHNQLSYPEGHKAAEIDTPNNPKPEPIHDDAISVPSDDGNGHNTAQAQDETHYNQSNTPHDKQNSDSKFESPPLRDDSPIDDRVARLSEDDESSKPQVDPTPHSEVETAQAVSHVLLDAATYAIASSPPGVSATTIADHVVIPLEKGVLIAGHTLSMGEKGVTISNTPISVDSTRIHVGGNTYPLPNALPTKAAPDPLATATINGQAIVPIANGVSVAGTVLTAGGKGITTLNMVLSLGSSSLIVGSSTVSYATSVERGSFVTKIASHVTTAGSNAFVSPSTTLRAGERKVTLGGIPVGSDDSSEFRLGSSTVILAEAPSESRTGAKGVNEERPAADAPEAATDLSNGDGSPGKGSSQSATRGSPAAVSTGETSADPTPSAASDTQSVDSGVARVIGGAGQRFSSIIVGTMFGAWLMI